jgi:glutaredoxin|tara:strand:+ start:400 stop:636 length:237 start_codon:yes stop_codon:yes gene_type:complete
MWTILTRSQCNFCDSAKALLKGMGESYTLYSVESPSSKWVLTMAKQAGYTTVPQIFKPDGTHIGGYRDLKEYFDETST